VKAPVVRLKIRVRLADGSRPYLDPVLSSNGKLKPLYAVVGGKPERRPEGSYFLRYAREGKRVWEGVGSDPQLAMIAKLKREKSLEAKAAGVELVEDKPQRKMTSLTEAVTEYLVEVETAKSEKTHAAYSHTLELFKQSTSREHLEEIERRDMLAFVKLMADRGNSRRTPGEPRELRQVLFQPVRTQGSPAEDRQDQVHPKGGHRVLSGGAEGPVRCCYPGGA
jgi:hypothetical protein